MTNLTAGKNAVTSGNMVINDVVTTTQKRQFSVGCVPRTCL